MMQKTVFGALVMILLLGLTGYALAQHGSDHGPQMMRQGQMGSSSGMWGPGMMGQGMMGPGMGMMGSPEIMGSMMSIRGEMMNLMGQMMQRYENALGQIAPELQQKMNKEMLEWMGEILTKHGAALKERAKAIGQ